MAKLKKMWLDPEKDFETVEFFGNILYGQREEVIWDKIIDDVKISITYEELFYKNKSSRFPHWTIRTFVWNTDFENWLYETTFMIFNEIEDVYKFINQLNTNGLTMKI